jgi:hypothetical protein
MPGTWARRYAISAPYSSGMPYPTVSGTFTVVAPALDRGSVDLARGSRSLRRAVLAAELDVVDELPCAIAHALDRPLDHLAGLLREHVLEVDLRARGVNTWMRPAAAGSTACAGALDVGRAARARAQTTRGFPAAPRGRDALDRLEVARLVIGKPASITSTPSRASWRRSRSSRGVERDAGRLLAVAKGGVEDA